MRRILLHMLYGITIPLISTVAIYILVTMIVQDANPIRGIVLANNSVPEIGFLLWCYTLTAWMGLIIVLFIIIPPFGNKNRYQ